MTDVPPVEEEARVEDITCVVDCGADQVIAFEVSIVAILIVGGLIFSRWRDLPVVGLAGLVGLVALFVIPTAIDYLVDGYFSWSSLPDFGHPALWGLLFVFYVVMTAIAAVAHAVRRGVLYVARRLTAAG